MPLPIYLASRAEHDAIQPGRSVRNLLGMDLGMALGQRLAPLPVSIAYTFLTSSVGHMSQYSQVVGLYKNVALTHCGGVIPYYRRTSLEFPAGYIPCRSFDPHSLYPSDKRIHS